MKLLCLFMLIPGILVLAACGESELLEDYFVDEARVLAVKIEDPEIRPRDNVTMKMLVGGKGIDQNMAATVFWAIDDAELIPLGESNYTQEFESQILTDPLEQDQWYDLPIYARIQVGQKYLNTQKVLRVTQNPVGKNPVISGVRLQYLNGEQLVEETAANADTVLLPVNTTNVALTAMTEDLAPGENDKLVFRWYVCISKNTNGKLYIQTDSKHIEAILGKGFKASEIRPSAVFSLRGEDGKKAVQSGIYDIYLVVRDNASDPQSSADERYGTDFIYFTICINSNC
jgi:hypothetical protein